MAYKFGDRPEEIWDAERIRMRAKQEGRSERTIRRQLLKALASKGIPTGNVRRDNAIARMRESGKLAWKPRGRQKVARCKECGQRLGPALRLRNAS